MAATQEHRPFGVTTPLGEDVLLLKSLTLVEELGRPFEASLDLLSDDAAIAFDDIVGREVTLRIETTRGSTRYVHGVVSRFAQREPLGMPELAARHPKSSPATPKAALRAALPKAPASLPTAPRCEAPASQRT
ncbi:MAG: hypothetical protein FJ290_01010 [Planctomycetes bacterium]|nr:hypothetical protein [Planctomycetota bacterium]